MPTCDDDDDDYEYLFYRVAI